MKRGRPRRFKTCPECGAEDMKVLYTYRAGHCVTVKCLCKKCGSTPRWVKPDGSGGHWFRVKGEEDIKKTLGK